MFFAQPAYAQPQKWHAVKEYGLRLAYPAHAAVCESSSEWGEHLHGWSLPIDGNCESATRAINVLADYNSEFSRTPEKATFCNEQGGSLPAGAKLKLSFPGRHSATCLKEKANGEILLTVVAQAWRWPGSDSKQDADFRTAWVNYTAYLWTTRPQLAKDIITLRSVLRRVQISSLE